MPDADATRQLLEVLEVRHNAKLGFGFGLIVAVVMYVYRVAELAGPVPSTRGSPALFIMLAFVLAATTGALVTIALTVRKAVQVSRNVD